MDERILKARLLCEGVQVSTEVASRIAAIQNPYQVKRGGLGAGIKAKLPSGIGVNFPLYSKTQCSISAIFDGGDAFIFMENRRVIGQAVMLGVKAIITPVLHHSSFFIFLPYTIPF